MKHHLDCESCGAPTPVGSSEVIRVICIDCITETWDPPKSSSSKKAVGYPKGWRFMKEFVHVDGNVYHRGVEQPHLKGTLPATVIQTKKKPNKFELQEERSRILVQINDLKKKLKKETRSTYIKRYESQLKKLQKKI